MTYAEVLAEAEAYLGEAAVLVLASFVVFAARVLMGMVRGTLSK